MSGVLSGVGLARQRVRGREALLAALVATLLVVLVGVLERRSTPRLAADHTLLGAVFGLALPLLAYAAAGAVGAGQRLDRSFEALARHGANRRAVSLGVLLLLGVLLSLAGALLAALAVLASRHIGDPRLASDLLTSSWVGALGGVSYATLFAAAACFGKRGGGRTWLLVLDWFLGSGVTLIALPWPRAHLRNLLGAAPVADLPQWASTPSLAALTLVGAAICLVRTRH